MLRIAFTLPLRQTEGLIASVLKLMDLTISAPDHTTQPSRGDAAGDPVSAAAARSVVRVDRQYWPAGLWGGSMARGETWREVAPEMAQIASGGGCRQLHDRGPGSHGSGR